MQSSSQKNYGCEPIWEATLPIFDEFVKICKKYKLRYFLTDGCALGTVRYKGFIPWDDDLDVSMPREDYERLISLPEMAFPPFLKLVTWRNCKSFPLLFAKLQDVRKDKIFEVERSVGHILSNGLFIDIFPVDGYPETKLSKFLIKLKRLVIVPLHRYRTSRFSEQSSKGKIAWMAGAALGAILPFWRSRESLLNYVERALKARPLMAGGMAGRATLKTDILLYPPVPSESWMGEKEMEFCGRQVALPVGLDAYLRSQYGDDYMTPPPENARHPAHVYPFRCAWWLGPDIGAAE